MLIPCPLNSGIGIASMLFMNDVLLCSHNPLLIKNIYGILIDEGCTVEVADHPALAVQMVMKKAFKTIIIDSEPFGLSVEDAINIIKTILPEASIIFVGSSNSIADSFSVKMPKDLEEFKRTFHDIKDYQNVR